MANIIAVASPKGAKSTEALCQPAVFAAHKPNRYVTVAKATAIEASHHAAA